MKNFILLLSIIVSANYCLAQKQKPLTSDEINEHEEEVLIDGQMSLSFDSKNGGGKFDFGNVQAITPIGNNDKLWIAADANVGLYLKHDDSYENSYSDAQLMMGIGIPVYRNAKTIVGFLVMAGLRAQEGIDYSYAKLQNSNYSEARFGLKPKIFFLTKSIRGELSLNKVFMPGKDSDVLHAEINKYWKRFVLKAEHTSIFNNQTNLKFHETRVGAAYRFSGDGLRVGPEVGVKNGKGYVGAKLSFNLKKAK